ncbi:hypothetical protein WEH80_18795 [Actinomycetes bacterium KLBMP 9759]
MTAANRARPAAHAAAVNGIQPAAPATTCRNTHHCASPIETSSSPPETTASSTAGTGGRRAHHSARTAGVVPIT